MSVAGDAAGACLAGLADGALRAARRRQRLARAGFGLVAAAVVGTAWVALADRAPSRAHVVQAATGDGSGKAARVSLLPVTSSVEHPCAQGSGGYTVPATESRPAFCVHADRAGGMTDVRVASAKAGKSTADGTWQVEVTLSPADRTRFAALARSLAEAPAPRNGFAVRIARRRQWGFGASASVRDPAQAPSSRPLSEPERILRSTAQARRCASSRGYGPGCHGPGHTHVGCSGEPSRGRVLQSLGPGPGALPRADRAAARTVRGPHVWPVDHRTTRRRCPHVAIALAAEAAAARAGGEASKRGSGLRNRSWTPRRKSSLSTAGLAVWRAMVLP